MSTFFEASRVAAVTAACAAVLSMTVLADTVAAQGQAAAAQAVQKSPAAPASQPSATATAPPAPGCPNGPCPQGGGFHHGMQGGRHGHHGMGDGQQPASASAPDSHAADMQLFHFLGDHGKEIRRSIKVLPAGVETVTESDNAEVATKIREHVASMSARVAQQRPIHMRDPLFAEVFRNAKLIRMTHEDTPAGVKVVETSDDPYVAKLIQAHAEVVSLFIKNGRDEMRKNHEVPAR